MSLPNVFNFLTNTNPVVHGVFNDDAEGISGPPIPGNSFLLLDVTSFLLLDGTNFLLLGT